MRRLLSSLAFVGLLSWTIMLLPGCNCPVPANYENATLRNLLGATAGQEMNEAFVTAALLSKFPLGTSYEDVLAALPPSFTELGLPQWVVTTTSPTEISIGGKVPTACDFVEQCAFAITLTFADGKLTQVEPLGTGCMGW